MHTQVFENAETFKQEIGRLEKQSTDLTACDDLKNMLFKVNALQRAIFAELNRRTMVGGYNE